MKVAFVGCGHGNLDLIYNNLAGSDVDLLIVCGDFEVWTSPSSSLPLLPSPSSSSLNFLVFFLYFLFLIPNQGLS